MVAKVVATSLLVLVWLRSAMDYTLKFRRDDLEIGRDGPVGIAKSPSPESDRS